MSVELERPIPLLGVAEDKIGEKLLVHSPGKSLTLTTIGKVYRIPSIIPQFLILQLCFHYQYNDGGPHLRHQASVEGLLELLPVAVDPNQLGQATSIFSRVVSRYEPPQASFGKYKHITLRVFHDSVISKGSFLRHFILFVDAELHHGQDHLELNFPKPYLALTILILGARNS